MTIRSDLILDQGTTFMVSVDLLDADNEPIDVTNIQAVAQLRKHYTSNNFVEITTELDEFTNELILSLTPEQTSNIEAGRYVYDVNLIFEDGTVDRILEGVITVSPQVTRI